MHYFRIIVLFILFNFNGFSQENTIESLKIFLQLAKNDTVRCDVLDQFIEIASDGEWQKYNEQMKKVASKNLALKKLIEEC